MFACLSRSRSPSCVRGFCVWAAAWEAQQTTSLASDQKIGFAPGRGHGVSAESWECDRRSTTNSYWPCVELCGAC